MDKKVIIECRGVGKNYTRGGMTNTVLKNVDLQIDEGEFVSIVGPSGSGKSTLLNLIGALDKPTIGEVHIGGTNVAKHGDNALAHLRGKKIGFIFQANYLQPYFDVINNILVPTFFNGNHKDSYDYALNLLEFVGLKDKAHAMPRELSGGEQQRVAVARAFVNRPQIILADEPTASLDRENAERVSDLLHKAGKEFGTAIVLVTHNEELAGRAQKVFKINYGELIK